MLSGFATLEAAGLVRPSSDAEVRAAFLLVNDLAVVLLRDQVHEVLGIDPLARSGMERWTAQVLDVYSRGVLTIGEVSSTRNGSASGGRVMTVVVSAEKLTKTFGSHRGIVGVDFVVTEGEIFGFLGPNGAGKSTTIRLLTGLSHPTSGTAKVFGLDPIADAVEIHRRVGYLPGELALHPRLTGRQHVDFAAKVRGMQDRTFLDELVDRFQVDLERPTRTLSKGNRQKIGILLAVMHRPELVILDEPTSGLDPLMQRRVRTSDA